MRTIYRIYNTVSNRSYIGCTTKTEKEGLKDWMRNCGRTKYADYVITEEYKKYGKESFKVEFLKAMENVAEAKELADKYIDEFGTLEPNGYNRNYMGVRKLNPDYYEKIGKKKIDIRSVNDDDELSIGEKTVLEQEMVSLYGLDNLVTPSNNKNYANKETIEGLRQFADDLEKYGNKDVLSVIPKKLDTELTANGEKITKILGQRAALNPDKKYTIISENSMLCIRCGKCKGKDNDFYKHIDETATYDGYIHICKSCLEKYCEQIYGFCNNPVYTLISLCQIMNIVFVQEIAEKAAEQWTRNKDYPKEIVKYYFSELKFDWMKRKDVPKTMLEFRNSHFIGDIFGFEDFHPAMPRVLIKDLNQKVLKDKIKGDKSTIETLEQKWGKGFRVEEYEAMEEEFQKLEKFLGKKTDLHIEALKKYIIYSYKEKTALAEGKDLKEIKEWSALADKAADSAQLKIKQLTGDFGDGVDSFAQLAETVEEYYSAIPTLPKARKIPYDDSDFLIWQIVNYIRRLEGKPETSYEEVYNFYDEELTKKMRDSGMDEEQIAKAKDERNAIFKDLSDNYQEPLWLLPVLGSDDEEDDDDEGGGL